MSGNRFLLDTNAIICLLQNDKSIVGILKQAKWIGISIISLIEFFSFSDLSDSDKSLFRKFIDRIIIIDLKAENSKYIELICSCRKSNKLKTPDAIIVASAIISDAILLTRDKEIISKIKDNVQTF